MVVYMHSHATYSNDLGPHVFPRLEQHPHRVAALGRLSYLHTQKCHTARRLDVLCMGLPPPHNERLI